MADLTVSGPTTKAADALRTLLAAQTAFQTWCGHAGDGSSSLAHIHLGPIADTDTLTYPFVQVYEPAAGEKDEAVGVNTFVRSVTLEVTIGKAVPTAQANDGRNAWVFVNDDYATLAGCLRALSGGETGGVRYVHRGVEEVVKPIFIARSENTDSKRYEKYEGKFRMVFGPGSA